jgi:glycosyltransferase involved in cell wall biosynthesis
LVSAYAFISKAQRDILAPVGIPAERSFVKYNFVPEPADQVPTKQQQIAYVGRLDAAKGASFLMRAWDAFRASRPTSGLRLVVAGGGQLSGQVTEWAASHPSVTFAGQISRPEVSAILGSSLAVVVPSQWEETFGMVAVEAMASGTGVIAADHGALPELVTAGSDGAVFGSTDLAGLVDLIGSVDDDPARWRRYGAQGRTTYVNGFTAEASLDRLIEIYRYAVAHPVTGTHRTMPALSPSAPRSTEVAPQ